jgi:hypothetical protein
MDFYGKNTFKPFCMVNKMKIIKKSFFKPGETDTPESGVTIEDSMDRGLSRIGG